MRASAFYLAAMTQRSRLLAPLLLVAALGAPPALGAAPFQDTADALHAERDAWLDQQGLVLGTNENGSWLGFGLATIDSAPGPTWGAARVAAFGRAEGQARSDFVEMTGVRVTVESLGRLFQDDGAFEELLDPSRPRRGALAAIEARLLELEGEELVQALELFDLDAEALSKLGAPERRVALAESFRDTVTQRAARSLRGLRVIQTFEVHGEETHSVGVLVAWSERNAALANVVRTGQGKISSAAEGKPLSEWLPADDDELYRDWGVRVFPGPEGEPIVVSFGQAAVGATPGEPPRAREARRSAAMVRAKSFALAHLTLFVNATTLVDQVTSRGEDFEVAMELDADGFAHHEPGASALVRTLDRTIKTQGQAVIVGGEVVRSWRRTLPGTEAEFCGVVYAWSPTRARLAYDFARGEGPGGEGEDAPKRDQGNDYPVDF